MQKKKKKKRFWVRESDIKEKILNLKWQAQHTHYSLDCHSPIFIRISLLLVREREKENNV